MRILLIEDEIKLANATKRALELQKYGRSIRVRSSLSTFFSVTTLHSYFDNGILDSIYESSTN